MGVTSALRRAFGIGEAKSVEGRALSIEDAKASRIWLRSLGMGGESAAGKTVTIENSLQLATVWACIRLISETVATLPLVLYRRGSDNGRTVASDHPLYTVLHDSPNADHTAVEFIEGIVFSLCTWGNAYALKLFAGPSSAPRLVGLEPLRADLMSVYRDEFGARAYRYADRLGMRSYTEDEIFHVRGFGNAGDVGLSPITFARQTIGAAIAADEASARMFSNGMRPSGVLGYDKVLTDQQRKDVRENILGPMMGSMNAGGAFVLEAGMTWSQITLSPEDAQMLQTRGWSVEELCRWFRVPPILVGHASSGQTMWGSGVEQIMLGWLTLGLRAYLSRIEQAVKRSLLAPAERVGLYAEFNIEALLRADSAGRAELYSKMAQNGIYTRNEIRARENLPQVEGGDTITVQSNLLPIDLLGKAPIMPAEKPVQSGAAVDDPQAPPVPRTPTGKA